MKHSWILAAVLLTAACSPQVYPLYMDVRNPSSSGLNLARKEISIVYRDGTNQVDSLFDRQAASSMARSLEGDYFGGEEKVGIYRLPELDSMSVELMHSLVMDTGGDVVFVLKTNLGIPAPETNQVVKDATSVDSAFVCPVAVPVKTHLDVYDSMGQDKVHSYNGSAVLRTRVFNNGLLTQEALERKPCAAWERRQKLWESASAGVSSPPGSRKPSASIILTWGPIPGSMASCR